MSNIIDTDYLAKSYDSSVKRLQAKNNRTQSGTFSDKLAEKSESVVAQYKRKHPEDASHVDAQVRAGKEVREKNGVADVSTKDMTMEEYKRFIYGLLDSIPFDATRVYDKEMISISDSGWEQMKNDLDYEAWVLGYTVGNRSVRNPFFGLSGASGSFYVEKFGASIEEHIGQSVGISNPGGRSKNIKNEKSWWDKRQEKMKERMKEQEKLAQKKAQARSTLAQEIYLNSRLKSQQRLQSFLADDMQSEMDNNYFPSSGISAFAAMAYENSISLFSRNLLKSSKS